MRLVKSGYVHFKCPECNEGLEDVADYEFYGEPNHEYEEYVCPRCKEKILVKCKITYKYHAKKLPNPSS